MKARLSGALALGLLLGVVASNAAFADIATLEQKKACTPDVYRLCAGEIPNVRAITACLRRQKANLSDACRAVFGG
jgi:predicted ribosomally synthesized peptide with SipW-like signal peptide